MNALYDSVVASEFNPLEFRLGPSIDVTYAERRALLTK